MASKVGAMDQNDELSAQVRRLWNCYDVSINRPCVKPELRLLQLKNDKRQAAYKNQETFRISHAAENRGTSGAAEVTNLVDPSNTDMSLVRGNDTTMLQSFHTTTRNKAMAGRSIFELVLERQKQFHNSEKSPS